jgi:zinc resistance-associated protein
MQSPRLGELSGAKLVSGTIPKEIRMKTLATLAGASLLALAGTSASAQPAAPAPSPAPGQQTQQPRPGPSRAEIDALTNARIAGIQAGLKLNADQQRLWTPVEQALRSMATDRAERIQERRERRQAERGTPGSQATQRQRPDLAQRLENQAERATQSAQRLTTLSTAVKPFWASLDESQKRLLPVLLHQGRGIGSRMAMQHDGDRMMRRGGETDHGPQRQ